MDIAARTAFKLQMLLEINENCNDTLGFITNLRLILITFVIQSLIRTNKYHIIIEYYNLLKNKVEIVFDIIFGVLGIAF